MTAPKLFLVAVFMTMAGPVWGQVPEPVANPYPPTQPPPLPKLPQSLKPGIPAQAQTPAIATIKKPTIKQPSDNAKAANSSGAKDSDDMADVDAAKMAEAQSIIDDIKLQNPPETFKLKAMLGFMQLITSSTEGINLGSLGTPDTTVALGLDGTIHLFGNFSVEAREIYTQNLFPESTSGNQSTAYESWFDGGPRYTFYLDSTRLDDTVVLKLLYHENYNNFLLNDSNALFVNYYQGLAGSIERNIPITSKLAILGSFDLLQIFNTASPSLNFYQGTTPTYNTIAKSGYGFGIQAEVDYRFVFDQRPVRLGIAYWQQGNQSEVDDSLKTHIGRESYFQVTRAIFATMSVLF